MSEAIAAYKALKEERKALEARITKEARVAFYKCAQELFEANPKLLSFGWTQYTQYFNDGDECYFGAHYHDAEINDLEEYDGDDESLTKEEHKDLKKTVVSFLRNFDTSEFETLFGDHCKVTITRGKDTAKVTEYTDHD